MSVKAPATFEVLAADGRRVRLGRDEYWRTVAEPAMRSAWDNPARLYPMALQALDEGFARELLPVAERLFRLAKGLEIGALILAEAQRKAGLLDACEQTLRNQLQKTGPSAFLLLNLAKVEGDRGRWQEELRLLGESVRLDPNEGNAVALWRALHIERFGVDAARRALEELAGLPGAWRPQMWLGRMASERGDAPAAIDLFRRALDTSCFERDCVLMAVGSLSCADGIAVLVDYDPLSDPAQVGLLLVELLSEVGRRSDAEALLRLIESRARQGFGGPRPPGTDQAILEQAQRLRARLGLT